MIKISGSSDEEVCCSHLTGRGRELVVGLENSAKYLVELVKLAGVAGII
jgi:hypothetical protein